VKDIVTAMANALLLELASATQAGLVPIVLNPAALLSVHMVAATARVAAHALKAGRARSVTSQCAAMTVLVMAIAFLLGSAAANSHTKVLTVPLL